MKAIAGGFVTLASWIGSFAISYSFNFLMDWNPAGKVLGHCPNQRVRQEIGQLLAVEGPVKNNKCFEMNVFIIADNLATGVSDSKLSASVCRYILYVLCSELGHCAVRGKASTRN